MENQFYCQFWLCWWFWIPELNSDTMKWSNFKACPTVTPNIYGYLLFSFLVCVCLDFLKPKTRINEKVGNKMRLAEPKTQLFKKSCFLGSGKIHVQNALHLWTSEVHKWKRAAGRFGLLPLVCAFTKMSLTQTHKLISSLKPSSLIYVFFLRLLPLRLPLLLHWSTPTINKTHFNLWYSEHRINKTKPKITQNQHKNNSKST